MLVVQSPLRADATLPQRVAKSDIPFMESESEIVSGAFPGLLLTPKALPNYRDAKYLQSYHAAVHVYVEAPRDDKLGETSYERRFVVCCQDRQGLPFAKKTARALLLLCNERKAHFRTDHPANQPVVNVWITGTKAPGVSADVGGEQFENQIYLHNVETDRSPVEWMREIAHEYGHYSLPGISGFETPEEWGNGVLGERLYLKWILESIANGRLNDENLGLGTREGLSGFVSEQVTPLMNEILRDGIDFKKLGSSNPASMNYYTGLALYIDSLYGSKTLFDIMAATHSKSRIALPRASDFLNAFTNSMKEEPESSLTLPLQSASPAETTIMLYFPAGDWNLSPSGSLTSWRGAPGVSLAQAHGKLGMTIRKAGWYRIYARQKTGSALPARLKIRKA